MDKKMNKKIANLLKQKNESKGVDSSIRDAKGRFVKGNQLRTKWTPQKTILFFQEAYNYLVKHENINFLVSLAAKMGYPKQIFSDLENKFVRLAEKDSTDKKIYKKTKTVVVYYKNLIDDLLQSRIVEKSFVGDGKAAFGIFVLKNLWGWNDKKDVNLKTQHVTPAPPPELEAEFDEFLEMKYNDNKISEQVDEIFKLNERDEKQ